QVVQPDPKQQVQAALDLVEDLPPRLLVTARHLDGVQEASQLGEVDVPELVDVLPGHGDEEPLRTETRPAAVRAHALDHHLAEPGLHVGMGRLPLAVAAVDPLDPREEALPPELPAGVPVLDRLPPGRLPDQDLWPRQA